ncbi:hypothetical protein ACB092_05G097800 [Castanea dentata]
MTPSRLLHALPIPNQCFLKRSQPGDQHGAQAASSFGLWCKKEKKGASDTIVGSAPHQSHLGRLPNKRNEDSSFLILPFGQDFRGKNETGRKERMTKRTSLKYEKGYRQFISHQLNQECVFMQE